MPEIGRNDPCPCGSGKKYKKCCLPSREAATAREHQAQNEARAREAAEQKERRKLELAAYRSALAEDDGLDEASNHVVDLLKAGKIDEAEIASRDLLARYPQVPDGLDRLGMVEEARGNNRAAAAYYRQAAAFESSTYELDREYKQVLLEKADALDPPGQA